MTMRARRKKKSPERIEDPSPNADAELDAFLASSGKKRPPKSARGRKFSKLELATREAERRAKSGEWDDATGATLVGLYALCHRMIYGVAPVELEDAATMRIAAKMAKRQLHKHFDDDPEEAVEFIKWTWEREKSRENHAIRTGRDRSRLGYRWQFSDGIVSDYRVDLERTRRRRKR